MKITNHWIYVNLTRKQAEHLGAVWNDKERMYRLPNTIGALRELYTLFPEHRPILGQEGTKKAIQRAKLLELKQLEDVPGRKELRPYQRVDVNYLKHIGSAGIFNEQRTGKTPTVLTLVEEKGFKHIVIVAPASLLYNWKEEVERWTNFKGILISGKKSERLMKFKESLLKNQNVSIISYETLRNSLTELLKILKESNKVLDCLIVDEAHRLRSLINGRRASKVSKAVVALGRHAQTRYALTGTPVVKEGQEIWGILHFLYPDRFPGYWQFVDRYFYQKFNGFGKEIAGYKRKKEIQEILAVISTNRKRKDVMRWLPDKQYQTIYLEMNKEQAKMYDDVYKTFVHEDVIDAPSVLAQLIRLRQIASTPCIFKEVPNEKEKFILEWLEDNPNESVIIFSTFSRYLEKLHQKIKGSLLITGKVSKEDRDKAVKAFQEGRCKVLLANIKSAGTGLTLDRGETVIFIDKEYNPSDNEQAEDRIVPTSKERNHSIHIISLVMKDTVDEMIEYLLKQKIDITKVINDGGIQALERLFKGGDS